MKKPQNKFILIIILLIISIVGYVIFNISANSNVDRSSYVILLNGKALLNDTELSIDKKAKLKMQDKIETIGESSLAMIKWGDGSITRMGGNSTIIINESFVDADLLNINISFELEKGKTWSNVISFIGKDSYFNQEFVDTTAAIRGTIFEVNLEKDYLYVESHEVKLTKDSGETQIVSEKTPFILSEFSFVSLIKFIKEIQDGDFRKLNLKLDKELYNDLVLKVGNLNRFTTSKISDISKLSSEKKQELYNETLKKYQELNFIDTQDSENYKKKLEIKQSLIDLSDSENKENLLITTLYDFKDLADKKQFDNLKSVTKILSDNSDSLEGLDIDLGNYINLELIESLKIPDGLKKEFEKNFDNIKKGINIDDFKNNEILDSAKKSIDGVLENINALTK